MIQRNVDMNKALFEASKTGRLEDAQRAIGAGADINTRDKAGWTPLHFASARGHAQVAQLLLSKNVNVNVQAYCSRWTPLWLAEQNNHEGDHQIIIDLLVKCGGKAI